MQSEPFDGGAKPGDDPLQETYNFLPKAENPAIPFSSSDSAGAVGGETWEHLRRLMRSPRWSENFYSKRP